MCGSDVSLRNKLNFAKASDKNPKMEKQMSHDMRFPTMWYVRPAKAQTSLRIRAV